MTAKTTEAQRSNEPSRTIPLKTAGAQAPPATAAAPSGARSAALDEKWMCPEPTFTRPDRVERVRADSHCRSRVEIADSARVLPNEKETRPGRAPRFLDPRHWLVRGRSAAIFCGTFRTASAAEADGCRPATAVTRRVSASRLAGDDNGKRGLATARLGRRLRS